MDVDEGKIHGSSKFKKRHWWTVNKDYVPLKLMYFFFMAGQACSIVYRSVFMRHLGLSTNQTGIIWMMERVVAMITPYLVGGVTDKTRKPKAVLLALLIGGAITVFLMYFIPPEQYVKSDLGRPVSWEEISRADTSFCWEIVCNDTSECKLSNPHTSAKSCHSNTIEIAPFQCNVILNDLLNISSLHKNEHDNISNTVSTPSNRTFLFQICPDNALNSTFTLPTSVTYHAEVQSNLYYANSSSKTSYICYEADSDDETVATCDAYVPNPVEEYGVTFWLVTVLMSISCITGVGIFPVLEATTFEVLGKDNRDKFGQQRLWASIGYGISALVIGYVKDVSATTTVGQSIDNQEFLPMFVGVLVCWSCAAVVSFTLPIKNEKKPSKVRLTDIKVVLKNPRALAFYGVLLFYGMTNAVRQIYLFWLAEEKLNSPSFILGVATMTGSFMDIPFCLSAGYLINKFGHIPLICFGVFAYAIRISSAAIIVDYWQLILIESLRGITWGLTWVVICSYTTKISPKGLEHSTMGITQGLVRGIAFSIGALLGGVIYQDKGGDFLFLICGLSNVIVTVVFGSFIFCTRKKVKREAPDEDGANEQITIKVNEEDSI